MQEKKQCFQQLRIFLPRHPNGADDRFLFNVSPKDIEDICQLLQNENKFILIGDMVFNKIHIVRFYVDDKSCYCSNREHHADPEAK